MKRFLAVVLVVVIAIVCACFNGIFYSTIQNVTGIGDKVVSILSSTITATVSSLKDSVQNLLGTSTPEENENKVVTEQEEKNDTRIRIALDEYIAWAPLLVANGGLVTTPDSMNGQAGLNIEYVLINDSSISSRALMEESLAGAGYSVNRFALLQDRFIEAGCDVTMPFIFNASNGSDGVIATNEIKTVEDLIGKKIAVPRFSESQTLIEWILMNSELTTEQQSEIRNNMVYCETADEAAKLFFSGSVDAASTWEPYLTMAEKADDADVLFSTRMNSNLILNGIAFRGDFLSENQDFVQKWAKNAFKAATIYEGSFDAVRQMPAFEFASDEEIMEHRWYIKFFTEAESRQLVNHEAISMYRDVANIWNALGERAYPELADEAFSFTF